MIANINELFPSAWISYNEKNIQVKDILSSEGKIVDSEGNKIDISDCFTIPVTDNILEKNGFVDVQKEFPSYKLCKIYTDKRRSIYIQSTWYGKYVNVLYMLPGERILNSISYSPTLPVHKLQFLLMFLNDECDIKL